MVGSVMATRKRAVDDGEDSSSEPPAAKALRFSRYNDYEGLAVVHGDNASPRRGTPITPQSVASTDARSIAETSMTSRNSSKRPKKYICEYDGCGQAFDRPVRLQAHVRTHTNDRPFACEEDGCDKSFFKAEHLKAHVQNKHSDQADHVCTYVVSTKDGREDVQCGKAFTTSTRLKRHVAAHEEKEDLKCQEVGCGQIFRKLETLQRHIKQTHLNEDPYRCEKTHHDQLTGTEEECGQTFATISQLKAHEVREHVGQTYFCDICPSPTDSNDQLGFNTYTDYQNHIKAVHPPTCSICFQVCPTNRALTAHMEIEHSTLASRQKFKCEYPGCSRGFTRKGNLNVHVQNAHKNERKFVCGEVDLSASEKCPSWNIGLAGCGEGFTTKASLEEHVRVKHLGLESLYHPRKSSRKIKQEATEDDLIDFDPPFTTSDKDNTLSLLTGTGYTDNRALACWNPSCPVRFTRDYDLAQHMELAHGWNVDDINERLAEVQALEGEVFWIGGGDGGEEGGVGGLPDLSVSEGLDLRSLTVGDEGGVRGRVLGRDVSGTGAGDGSFMDGVEGYEDSMDQREWPFTAGLNQNAADDLVLDPALSAM